MYLIFCNNLKIKFMLSLSFKPSLKVVVYSLIFSFFACTMYGTFCGNNFFAATAFIALMLTILLFADRKKAVNDQTTNGDMIVTGVALMILLPLGVSIIMAIALGNLILGTGFEKTFSGILMLLLTTVAIYYGIRIASRYFERRNWKLPLDQ